MLEPRDWDEQYLLNLPPGEFDWVEAKGRRWIDLKLPSVKEADVIDGLSKAISAFANSGGGVLVLGAEDPRQGWHIDDGGIDLFVKPSGTREWLEDIIPVLVDPTLITFNVYPLKPAHQNSQIAQGRGVFIIDIHDSDQAPHQARDNKYYGRLGGKSKPLGHRFVMDIYGRRRDPEIVLEFSITTTHRIKKEAKKPQNTSASFDPLSGIPSFLPLMSKQMIPLGPTPPEFSAELIIVARNVGRVYANYVNCSVFIPVGLIEEKRLKRNPARLVTRGGNQYYVRSVTNTQRDVVKYDMGRAHEYGPSWFSPILPGLTDVWIQDLREDLIMDMLEAEDQIIWEAFADNAVKRTGTIKVQDIAFKATVIEPKEPSEKS